MKFAKIDIFRKILKVIEADQDFIDRLPGQWVPCDQVKNPPGLGYTLDLDRMAFIEPKPYPTWILNEETCQWESPTPYPTDGRKYYWEVETNDWELI